MRPIKRGISKKRLLIIAAIIAVLITLGGAVYYVVSSNKNETILQPDGIYTVDRGDLTSLYTTSAMVESGRKGTFDILEGTKIDSVAVRVGDTVKKGDLLATFDTASLDAMLKAKKKDYDNARSSYQEYLKNAADAPKQAAKLQKEITALEKSIAKMQKEEEKQAAETESATSSQNSGNAQLEELKTSVAELLGNGWLANRIVNQVFAENGSIAETISAFQNLLGGSLMGGADLSSMMGSMGMLSNSDLMNASLQLIQLKVQQSLLNVQADVNLESVYKSLSDSAESAYRQAEATASLLKEGWYAEADGIIREVNIVEGETYRSEESSSSAASSINVTSLLASLSAGNADIGSLLGGLFSNTVSGMAVEYYPFTASFLLGKYDIAKVALDQHVVVTSVSGQEFDAVVSFISPVAEESSEINLSSLMGASGSSRGVETRITIPQPDKSITIGLDVDVSIELETKDNVLRIPVESVLRDDETGSDYVFVLDRGDKTIRKQFIDTGLFDGSTYYELTKGLEEGDEIVRQPPQRGLEDGDKVKLA